MHALLSGRRRLLLSAVKPDEHLKPQRAPLVRRKPGAHRCLAHCFQNGFEPGID